MQPNESISIKFSDGVLSTIQIFRNTRNPNAPVMVILPALGVKGSYYKNAALYFSAHHFHVVTIDHRGHGSSSIRPSRKNNFGYREQIEIEYVEILQKVKSVFAQNKVVILGHSLGGQMGSMFLARYPELADGLILNASCSVYWKGWGPVFGVGLFLFAFFSYYLSLFLGYYPGNKIGFGGVEAIGIIRDWFFTARTSVFAAHGSSFNYQVAMKNMKRPVLGITYEGDTSAPPQALKYLTDIFRSADVNTIHLLPSHPNREKYNHYKWAKQPSLCSDIILHWYNKNINIQS